MGPEGSGKSVLARHTVNFIHERNYIDGGCIFVDCSEITSLAQLIEAIVARVKGDKSDWLDLITKSNEQDKFSRILDVFNAHSEQSFLFFFDNADALDDHFIKWCDQVLDDCQNAKILITSKTSTYLSKEECPPLEVTGLHEVKELAWDLFYKFSGEKVKNDEKKELAKKLPDKTIFPDQYRSKRPNYRYDRLGDHHLFELQSYNPRVIKSIATNFKSSGMRLA